MVKKTLKKIIKNFGYEIRMIPKLKIEEEPEQINSSNNLPTVYDQVPLGGRALQKLIEDFEFETVLDIGSGQGKHSEILNHFGKKVTAIDFGTSVYYQNKSDNFICIIGDYFSYQFDKQFDAIWASHVLEHQPNPNLFLKKIFNDLKENGILVITVPPLKHEIVGGHLTLWNSGLLIYNLIFAGFDCKNISILKYGYNISVILKKNTIKEFPKLDFDKGDIDRLINYFPDGFEEPFDGDISELNWV